MNKIRIVHFALNNLRGQINLYNFGRHIGYRECVTNTERFELFIRTFVSVGAIRQITLPTPDVTKLEGHWGLSSLI